VNGGFRDSRQRHGYSRREFGPAASITRSTPRGSGCPHPRRDHQRPRDPLPPEHAGPGPELPLDLRRHPAAQAAHGALRRADPDAPLQRAADRPVTANNGFGRHTITTHEHNGHNPAESDGYTGAFFFPGQFYDYRWPLQLAGYSNNNNAAGAINYDASDPRAAIPLRGGRNVLVLVNGDEWVRTCENGRINIPGDWRETMSTHWFHDHMLDFTAENVYKGNATMMNYYSALDRGNEASNDGVNLRFPSGTALLGQPRLRRQPAGGRQGLGRQKASSGSTSQHRRLPGRPDDCQLAVQALLRRARAQATASASSTARCRAIMAIALVQQVAGRRRRDAGPAGLRVSYNRVPFHMIANDGNIMEHAVPFDGKHGLRRGQASWKGPSSRPRPSPSATTSSSTSASTASSPATSSTSSTCWSTQTAGAPRARSRWRISSPKYNPIVIGDGGRWINGDPAVGKFLELRVHAYSGTDLSMNPADYEPGKAKMIPLPIDRDDPADRAERHRRGPVDHQDRWGQRRRLHHGSQKAFRRRLSSPTALPKPVLPATALSRSGPSMATAAGAIRSTSTSKKGSSSRVTGSRLPNGRSGPARTSTGSAPRRTVPTGRDRYPVPGIRRDLHGALPQHQHEDHAMLLRWDLEHPGQVQLMPTPLPTWDGVEYVDSAALPTFVADCGRPRFQLSLHGTLGSRLLPQRPAGQPRGETGALFR
jgi:manganese oxidase